MKLLKILLYIILALVVLVLLGGLFAKKDYHIERSINIKAPQEVVHQQISFFKNIDKWSPWAKLDPNMTKSMEGTDGTVGCTQKWSGNDKVGVGEQSFTAITPDQVVTEVRFQEPWESKSPATMKLSSQNGETNAKWSMDMHMPFPTNIFGMFTDMDKAIGADYERGLSNLKVICEGIAAKPMFNGYEVMDAPATPRTYLGMRKTLSFSEMGDYFSTNMPKIFETAGKAGVQPIGPPTSLMWYFDEKNMKTDLAVAVPVAANTKAPASTQVYSVNAARMLTVNYYGGYEKTGLAHLAMDEYMAKSGLKNVAPVLEEYITDPMTEKDTAKWLTKVIYYVNPVAPIK